MKAAAEKSTHTTPAQLQTKPARPFFSKAGSGDFFAPVNNSAPPSIQTKLAVNIPGDKYEVEADHMANKVMRMSLSGKRGGEKELESQPERRLQRKESEATPSSDHHFQQQGESQTHFTSEQTEATIRSKTSGGQPLPAETRSFMEPRFGNDFSNVRIHQDQGAAQLNHQLNARAFTYQNHIFFGPGQYQPQTVQGKQLLAHELTHVVQQGASKEGNDNSQKMNHPGDERVQAKPMQTGTSVIQRGLLDDVKQGVSEVTGAIGDIINNVRQAIGGGIAAATDWIRNIASAIGAGISEAWTFIRNLATSIGQGVAAAWTFIQGIASRIGQAVAPAWTWIRGLAANINMGITNAWSWIQATATKLAMTITSGWKYIQSLASKVAMNITAAWNWIQSVASGIAGTITKAWNWVQEIATRIGMNLPASWNWVKVVASRIAMGITAAWNWVQAVASGMAMAITNAWNLIQSIASGLATSITNAWNLIQAIARGLAMAITNAWIKIQSIASRLAMAINNAWNWVQSLASRLATGITNAWNWVQAMASRIAMQISAAWNWVQSLASRLAMAITNAWNWVQAMASRIVMGIISAWNWIQSVASRIAMAISRAWSWVQAMASQILLGIVAAWNWLINKVKQLGKMIADAWNWIINMAKIIGKAILQAWDWLVNFAKNVLKGIMNLLEALDYYLRAPDFTIQTQYIAPDGSGRARSKVGVGEQVTFKGSKIGDWKATGGTPVSLASNQNFVWTAPDRGASVTISLTSGKHTRTKEIVVVEPNAVTGRRTDVLSYNRDIMGAGMELKFLYHPKNVSFMNVEAGEVSGPASDIEGYFEDFSGKLEHKSGDRFFPLEINNENSATDTAAIKGFPKPWEFGKFKWVIPNRYRVKTEGGDGKVFTNVEQAFTLENESGKTTVKKAGAGVSRTPSP